MVRPALVVCALALGLASVTAEAVAVQRAPKSYYLALGDSFTAGTGNPPSAAFPSRLASLWRAQGREVTLKNVAVDGYTTVDVLEKEIPQVAPFHPTLVTLAVGANDRVRGWSADVYRSNVRVLFRAIIDAGRSPKPTAPIPDRPGRRCRRGRSCGW